MSWVILYSWEATHTTLPFNSMSKITQHVSSWSKGLNLTASIYLWPGKPTSLYAVVYSDSPETKTHLYLGNAEAALLAEGFVKEG